MTYEQQKEITYKRARGIFMMLLRERLDVADINHRYGDLITIELVKPRIGIQIRVLDNRMVNIYRYKMPAECNVGMTDENLVKMIVKEVTGHEIEC